MLTGQRALITGATGELGGAIARLFASQGAELVLLGHSPDKVAELATRHPKAQVAALDLADQDAVKTCFTGLTKSPPDILVNAAGSLFEANIAMTRLDDLQQQLQLNLVAAYQCCQLASRLMAKKGRGSIINFGSQVAEQGSAGQSAYAASKGGLSALTRALAAELGPQGIRVNAIAPGFIDSPMTAHYSEAKRQQLQQQTALRRLGQAEDIAQVALFLASAQSAFVTGQVLNVDGGLSL